MIEIGRFGASIPVLSAGNVMLLLPKVSKWTSRRANTTKLGQVPPNLTLCQYSNDVDSLLGEIKTRAGLFLCVAASLRRWSDAAWLAEAGSLLFVF